MPLYTDVWDDTVNQSDSYLLNDETIFRESENGYYLINYLFETDGGIRLANIVPQTPNYKGIKLTYSAVSATGDAIINSGGKVMVIIKNGGTASTTVTSSTTVPQEYGDPVPISVTIPAGEDRTIYLDQDFNNNVGAVPLICNPITSVTIAAIKLV